MNKVVLITGASSGLGKVLVEKFSSDGYVVFAGARDVSKIQTKDENIFPIKLDITIDKDCKNAVEEIIRKLGRIDVLINSAGYSLSGTSVNFTPQDYLSILDTNTVGAFRLIQQVVPHMKERKRGNIINITSLSGIAAFPNFGLYSSSKFALEALGSSLKHELENDGIAVTNVAPGAIKSDVSVKSKITHKTAREKFKLINILMPMITKEEVANKVLEITRSTNAPVSVMMGYDTKIIYILQKILPSFLWNKLQSYIWNRK